MIYSSIIKSILHHNPSPVISFYKSIWERVRKVRMREKKIILLTIITSISCSQNLRNYKKVELFVPKNSIITTDEIRNAIPETKKNGNLILRVVVYRYSSGKKIISFQGDRYSEIEKSGEIKILLKFYQDKSLKKAIFIKVKNKNKKEMLDKLSIKIKKILSSI